MYAFLVESYERNVHSYCEVTAIPCTLVKYEVVEFPVPACEYVTAFEGRNGIVITGCFLVVFVCIDSHLGRNAFGHYTTVGIKGDKPIAEELIDSFGLNITTVKTCSGLLAFCVVGRFNCYRPFRPVSVRTLNVDSYESNALLNCIVTAVPVTGIEHIVVCFPVPSFKYKTYFGSGRNGIIVTSCFLVVFVVVNGELKESAFGHYTTVGIEGDNVILCRSFESGDFLGLNITAVETCSGLLTCYAYLRLNSYSPITEVSMCTLFVESYESNAILYCIVTGIPVTLVESVVVCFPVPACEYITNLEGRNGIVVTSSFLVVFVVVDGELKESAFGHYTTVGIEGDNVILGFGLNGSFDYGQAGAFAADSKTGGKFNTARGRILIVSAAESYNRCAGCFIKREYVVLFKICRATNCDSITDSYVTVVLNNDSNTVGGTNCTAVGTVDLNVSTVNDKSVAGLVSDIEAVNINFNILLCGNSVRTGLLFCKKNDLVTCYSCIDCSLKISVSCAAFDICLAF